MILKAFVDISQPSPFSGLAENEALHERLKQLVGEGKISEEAFKEIEREVSRAFES